MDANGVKKFQDAMAEKIHALDVETAYVDGGDGQIGGTLRALLPVTDAGDASLMEIMVTEFEEGSDLLLFYTTMIVEIGPGYEALKEMLLDWNLRCPMGAFGIFRQARQFYHKYTVPVPKDAEPEALAEKAMELLEMLYEVISRQFPEAVRLSGHQ